MAKSAPSALAGIDPTTLGLGLVGVTVAGALAVGLATSVATSLLVFVTGALLGSILLVWHSLRTLAGDADVEADLDAATGRGPKLDLELLEHKRRALRGLKDIAQENALGKLDDADFKKLDAEYRALAKDAIRALDESIAPYRDKAEALVRSHLEKRAADRAREPEGDACPKCKTKNDADATFCKKCGSKLTSDE